MATLLYHIDTHMLMGNMRGFLTIFDTSLASSVVGPKDIQKMTKYLTNYDIASHF